MKSISTLIGSMLLILLVGAAASQTGPIGAGSLSLQGSIGYIMKGGDLYENDKGDGYTDLYVNPNVGYFVINGLRVSLWGYFDNYSQGDSKGSTIGIGPSISYYFGKNEVDAKGKTYPFVGIGYAFYSGSEESPVATANGGSEISKTESSGTSLACSAGLNYMLTNSVGFYSAFTYYVDSFKQGPKGAKVDALSGNDVRIHFGLTAYLPVGKIF